MKSEKPFILLVTANENEKNALLATDSGFMLEKQNYVSADKSDNSYYNLGNFCGFNAVHLHLLEQGSSGADASQASISRAIKNFNVKVVVLVGICFGFDSSKYNPNDVFISDKIIDYERAAIIDRNYQHRGSQLLCGRFLLNSIKTFLSDWQHVTNKKRATASIGEVLSGDKLVRSEEFKKQLLDSFPRSIGGEMEGRGAAYACRENGISEFIIIKAISDWGNASKNDSYQITAAVAAVSLLKHVFSKAQVQSMLNKVYMGINNNTSLSIDENLMRVLIKFEHYDFKENVHSKMVQADESSPETTTPNLSDVFIKLSCNRDNDYFFERVNVFDLIVSSGNIPLTYSQICFNRTFNDNRGIGRRFNLNNNMILLKGHAGQGKSTICQFIAQVHRAIFIRDNINFNNNKVLPKDVTKFLKQLSLQNGKDHIRARIPLCIKLKEYAAWISMKKRNSEHDFDIISYLSSNVNNIVNDDFDIIKLRNLFSCTNLSWLVIFDGLDEVPTTVNRIDIMTCIEYFIDTEMRQLDSDVLYLATTRPDSYNDDFEKIHFLGYTLSFLTKEEGIDYVKRYYDSIPMEKKLRKKCLETYIKIADDKPYKNLITTPLNVTIMALLIRSEGELPRDQFSLYEEYFNTIVKREKNKANSETLRDYEREIKNIYGKLGFTLQSVSAKQTYASTTISEKELTELIRKFIEPRFEFTDSDQKKDQVATLIKDVIVERVAFVSQMHSDYYFRIRSIQEFLAAKYIEDTFNQKQKLVFIEKMAQNSYWRNTFNLLVQYLHKKDSPVVGIIIDTILKQLNDSCIDSTKETPNHLIYMGSQIAFDLLTTNIFVDNKKLENNLISYIEEGFNLQFSKNHYNKLALFSDHSIRQLSAKVSEKLDQGLKSTTILTYASILAYHFNCLNVQEAIKLAKINDSIILSKYFNVFDEYRCEGIKKVAYEAIKRNELIQLSAQDILSIINKYNCSDKIIKNNLLRHFIKAFFCEGASFDFIKDNEKSINEYFGYSIVSILLALLETGESVNIFKESLYIRFENHLEENKDICELKLMTKEAGLDLLNAAIQCLIDRDTNSCRNFINVFINSEEEYNTFRYSQFFSKKKILLTLKGLVKKYDEEKRVVIDNINTCIPRNIEEYVKHLDAKMLTLYSTQIFCALNELIACDLYKYFKENVKDFTNNKKLIELMGFVLFNEYDHILSSKGFKKNIINKYSIMAKDLLNLLNIQDSISSWHIRLALLVGIMNKEQHITFKDLPINKGYYNTYCLESGIMKEKRVEIVSNYTLKIFNGKHKPSKTELEIAYELLMESNDHKHLSKLYFHKMDDVTDDRIKVIEYITKKRHIDYHNLTDKAQRLFFHIITNGKQRFSNYSIKEIMHILCIARKMKNEKLAFECEKELYEYLSSRNIYNIKKQTSITIK